MQKLSLLAQKINAGTVVCLAEEYNSERREASIVAKANGQKPIAEKIFGKAESESNAQALIALRPRYLYLKGYVRNNNKLFIRIYRIIRFRIQEEVPIVEVRMFNRFSRGRWLIPLFVWLNPAVEALKDKLLNPDNLAVYAHSPEEKKRYVKKRKLYKKPPVR